MTRLVLRLLGLAAAFTAGALVMAVLAGASLDPPGDASMPGERR